MSIIYTVKTINMSIINMFIQLKLLNIIQLKQFYNIET